MTNETHVFKTHVSPQMNIFIMITRIIHTSKLTKTKSFVYFIVYYNLSLTQERLIWSNLT